MELKIMEEKYDRYEDNDVDLSKIRDNEYLLVEFDEQKGVRTTIFNSETGGILRI